MLAFVSETQTHLTTISFNLKLFMIIFQVKVMLGHSYYHLYALKGNFTDLFLCTTVTMKFEPSTSCDSLTTSSLLRVSSFELFIFEFFFQFKFNSYSAEDDDYEGYDYSLEGQLSAVRIVFLYRFVQEVRLENLINLVSN